MSDSGFIYVFFSVGVRSCVCKTCGTSLCFQWSHHRYEREREKCEDHILTRGGKTQAARHEGTTKEPSLVCCLTPYGLPIGSYSTVATARLRVIFVNILSMSAAMDRSALYLSVSVLCLSALCPCLVFCLCLCLCIVCKRRHTHKFNSRYVWFMSHTHKYTHARTSCLPTHAGQSINLWENHVDEPQRYRLLDWLECY